MHTFPSGSVGVLQVFENQAILATRRSQVKDLDVDWCFHMLRTVFHLMYVNSDVCSTKKDSKKTDTASEDFENRAEVILAHFTIIYITP